MNQRPLHERLIALFKASINDDSLQGLLSEADKLYLTVVSGAGSDGWAHDERDTILYQLLKFRLALHQSQGDVERMVHDAEILLSLSTREFGDNIPFVLAKLQFHRSEYSKAIPLFHQAIIENSSKKEAAYFGAIAASRLEEWDSLGDFIATLLSEASEADLPIAHELQLHYFLNTYMYNDALFLTSRLVGKDESLLEPYLLRMRVLVPVGAIRALLEDLQHLLINLDSFYQGRLTEDALEHLKSLDLQGLTDREEYLSDNFGSMFCDLYTSSHKENQGKSALERAKSLGVTEKMGYFTRFSAELAPLEAHKKPIAPLIIKWHNLLLQNDPQNHAQPPQTRARPSTKPSRISLEEEVRVSKTFQDAHSPSRSKGVEDETERVVTPYKKRSNGRSEGSFSEDDPQTPNKNKGSKVPSKKSVRDSAKGKTGESPDSTKGVAPSTAHPLSQQKNTKKNSTIQDDTIKKSNAVKKSVSTDKSAVADKKNTASEDGAKKGTAPKGVKGKAASKKTTSATTSTKDAGTKKSTTASKSTAPKRTGKNTTKSTDATSTPTKGKPKKGA